MSRCSRRPRARRIRVRLPGRDTRELEGRWWRHCEDTAVEAAYLVESDGDDGRPRLMLGLVGEPGATATVDVPDGTDVVWLEEPLLAQVRAIAEPFHRRASRTMSALRVTRDGPFARVTLARAEVRNAFNAEMIGGAAATFEALAAEPPDVLRGVVIAGEGSVFCAGADVEWMRASVGLSVEENERDAAAMQAMFMAIDDCPAPVIARVQGAALGGGMGLCAVADIVIATADASFGFTETKLGIIPAVISTFVLPKIGESHARALFVTGQRFDAERARAIGLVHELAGDEDGSRRRVERAARRAALRRAERRPRGQGARSRAADMPPTEGPRRDRPSYRAAANVAGGAGRAGRIRREAPPGLVAAERVVACRGRR